MIQTLVRENATPVFERIVFSALDPGSHGHDAEKAIELAQGLLNKMTISIAR